MASKIIFLLFVIFTLQAQGNSCLLSEIMKDARLADNASFWEEYGQLVSKGKVSDRELQALASKHGGLAKTETAAPASAPTKVKANGFERSREVSITSQGAKDIRGLTKNLKEKVEAFSKEASEPGGIQKIRERRSYHMERLPQFGRNAYSVRINDGDRILFDLTDDTVTIRGVNADKIHRN